MSLNPLNELKRRLDDESIHLPKRLCLARNVVSSHHFPTAPKERVVAEWLEGLMRTNRLTGEELKGVVGWLAVVDDLTNELKGRLIKLVSQYLQKNPLQDDNIQCILSFVENSKISTQLTLQIDDYLLITTTLLQYLRKDESNDYPLSQRILNNLVKFYKECKKKLEFTVKLLNGENLETIFSYLDTECRSTIINVCQSILFPMNKKSFFVSFVQTLIRKENIDELIAEKGDNIQSVLKIMSSFFTFPKGRTGKDQTFLSDFIDVFVSCFKNENQLIFAFYVMVVSSLNMSQSYLSPAMKMPPIIFEENDDKIKRNLFLKMLEILLKNEVDINVRLTDTFGEKVSKVEIKKNFTSFLQAVMMGQLKLDGKLDKSTLQIIKTALKLDPVLVEQKIDQILPPIMTAKKNNLSILEPYTEMLNCLLEILFKLSRGTLFINQILPHLKVSLEASNTEQFELKQQIKEATENGIDCKKLISKLITGNDVFPQESIELYGKLTSELMFRQNKELLMSLQKDFEEHCLMMLEEGFVSPSIITLAEVLSAILSSFLRHNKMADHTVPAQVADDFWASYRAFEDECLRKFGQCVLRLSYNAPLALSFLRLCLSFSHLKLLNIKYSNYKLEVSPDTQTSEAFDLSVILPCLSSGQWMALCEKVTEDEAVLVLDNLLLAKTMAIKLLSPKDHNENQTDSISTTKSHLIRQLNTQPDMLTTNSYFAKVLFADLERNQMKHVAKSLVKLCQSNPELELIRSDAVLSNRALINAIVLEIVKNLGKCFDNIDDLTKRLNKSDFDVTSFAKEVNIEEYFNNITLKDNQEDIILNCIEILKQLPIYSLEEPHQLLTIFFLLITKKCCPAKKIRKITDHILHNLYEMTPKCPDLYKIFPIDFIFSFEDKTLMELLTLKIKNCNNMLLIKSILEASVKKVKTDSEVVKKIVGILLNKQKTNGDNTSSIEYFSNPIFQITCIILPIIAKERKAITTSAFRSILATLQEKLYKFMLKSYKNIDFSSNSSLLINTTDNTDDSVVVSDTTLATLNAMGAYSLILAKYCGTTDLEELKNLDCLWSGLEFFMQNAIQTIQNPTAKNHHIDSSIQLLNVVLRSMKKLETHPVFQDKDKLFQEIWKSILTRLHIVFGRDAKTKINNASCLEEIAVMLKCICELISVDCFNTTVVKNLTDLGELKKPSQVSKSDDSTSVLTAHKVSRYLWIQCLKANIVGPKCVALSKLVYRNCKAIRFWVQQNYEFNHDQVLNRKERHVEDVSMWENDEREFKVVMIEDDVCEMLRIDLDAISEVILANKKISLDYKSLDCIFSLQHCIFSVHSAKMSARAGLRLLEGGGAVLNGLVVARAELMEDRWPNYMQCYRALVTCVCERAALAQPGRACEQSLAEIAHSVEKLTQSICKRKTHISRIASYTVADICTLLELHAPPRMVRQHLENTVALLIQASDSSYSMAFLRRALAGKPGHMTMTNMYTMYKRYHKYVGNA